MGMLLIEVWDPTGSKRQQAEVPDDVAVNRLLVVLTEKLHLPQTGPDGQMLSYKFHHKASGTQLLDRQTLREAGVAPGDILRLQPEITAGRLAGSRFHA
jgi:uncharacterized ubiquitin-like protein YukD